MTRKWIRTLGASCILLLVTAFAHAGDVTSALAEQRTSQQGTIDLATGFRTPPDETKPWCYWYWISDTISREGITKDLEAMARVGIGEAFIGNIFLDDVPAGNVKVFSDSWWELVEHALREGSRVGVNIGMFNCPGWSQSGGPWIKPEQAMRYLVSSETRVQGPLRFEEKLATPQTPFQDVAVIAFPSPAEDDQGLSGRKMAGDGFRFVFTSDQPFTARSLSLTPTAVPWKAAAVLRVQGDDGNTRDLKTFSFDRSNMKVNVGPMPRGPVTISFPATTACRFEVVFPDAPANAALENAVLHAGARLESYVEKQLGKMHPTPLPMWDDYKWPAPAEPNGPSLIVSPENIANLSDRLADDGTLTWDVPAGDWIIQRIGMTPTGTCNAPASPEAQGLEVDKMNRALAAHHFEQFIGQVLHRVPKEERGAFTRVIADSYEMGSQNWTDRFEKTFQETYGYDPIPWLAVLQGRLVGSADQSERFLWDLRRLVADRIASEYVGGLSELSRKHGLALWLENYGHWGFPGEFLKYGSRSDRIGGEYWVTGSLGSIECRAASSCANTYGKKFVSAEAFTGGPPFQNALQDLKARGDWSFCEGINHFVLHVYIHQPWEDRRPGVNAWFGSEFNRHNTWFDQSSAWIEYVRRCCWMLQQGTRVADVAYFIGEDTPAMTGVRRPALPEGFDFDYINAEVIENDLTVENGLLKLPHGTTYQVLVLPPRTSMCPAVLGKIRDLVRGAATVVGPLPSRSPSMEDFPHCDAEVKQLTEELRTGQHRVVASEDLSEVFTSLNLGPDFESDAPLRFTHRRLGDTDIYFVANPTDRPVTTVASFRAAGKAPELWRPDTGRIEQPAVYDVDENVVRVPLHFDVHGSVFVVFRRQARAERVVAVERNGEPLLSTVMTEAASLVVDTMAADSFTLAGWVKPADDTTLHAETNHGVRGLREKRNDAIFPPHGDTISAAGNHAGAGLAVGRNGVCVFEHGANYFAPVLVHATAVNDWTHVAVVYRDGQPSLYLDGVFVHRGLKSTHIVHPGSVESNAGDAFRGELGRFRHVTRALDATEIADLAKRMPRPEKGRPPVAIELGYGAEGQLQALAWQSGDYVLQMADQRSRTLSITLLPKPREILGPWSVAFDPLRGGPGTLTLETLTDWTQHADPRVKYYSGTATYQSRFDLPDSLADQRLYLDLGDVRDLAAVRVNGKELGILWNAPWLVEITHAARRGQNSLQIDVVNPWNNRLVGDANLPPEERKTFLAVPTIKQNSPLLPAGLIGPVTVRFAREMEMRNTP